MAIFNFILLYWVTYFIFTIYTLGAANMKSITEILLFFVIATLLIAFFEFYFITTIFATVAEFKIINNINLNKLEKFFNKVFYVISIILFIFLLVIKFID